MDVERWKSRKQRKRRVYVSRLNKPFVYKQQKKKVSAFERFIGISQVDTEYGHIPLYNNTKPYTVLYIYPFSSSIQFSTFILSDPISLESYFIYLVRVYCLLLRVCFTVYLYTYLAKSLLFILYCIFLYLLYFVYKCLYATGNSISLRESSQSDP